ncbi:MAG: CAP domain-containing protein [Verrucomicrobia bacterium]|nr:CAP domain-containing protein [Verrucomicrobiota bacterium]
MMLLREPRQFLERARRSQSVATGIADSLAELIRLGLCGAWLICCASPAQSATTEMPQHDRPAPPPAPIPPRREFPEASSPPRPPQLQGVPSGLTLYSIGEPTDEEQLYLEFINRARSNPATEGERLRDTTDAEVLQEYKNRPLDLNLMTSQFEAIAPAAPLSMNRGMTLAARLHSQDMLANQFQDHAGTDGSTIEDRINAQGYAWSALGENVYSRARSVWHGHAAFNVDWGGDASTGGMQNPPGHRIAIHEPVYREIGIGVVHGSNGTFGPQVVTQDFGRPRNLVPFVTGVAYYDLNQNSFYDLGEGIQGATVLVEGSLSYAISASSGGYSVPVPGPGTFTVAFSIPGLPVTKTTVVVATNENVKADYSPPYRPPAISGSDQPTVGQANTYQISVVGGATGYRWKQSRRIPAVEPEGAEVGLARVTAATSPGYDVIDTAVKASGKSSFHLAHPEPKDQVLTLNRLYQVSENSQFIFAGRLGLAGTAQTAKAQVSADRGASWQNVWSRSGTEDRGQVAFVIETIPLRSFADQEIMIRFRYDSGIGTFSADTDPGVGFYIDDILLTEAEELTDEASADASPGGAFAFTPVAKGEYSLRARAKVASRIFPWGPAILITAQEGGVAQPRARIISIQKLPGGGVQIVFEVTGALSVAPELESSDSVLGPWAPEAAAVVETIQAGGRFRASSPISPGTERFYRVRLRN